LLLEQNSDVYFSVTTASCATATEFSKACEAALMAPDPNPKWAEKLANSIYALPTRRWRNATTAAGGQPRAQCGAHIWSKNDRTHNCPRLRRHHQFVGAPVNRLFLNRWWANKGLRGDHFIRRVSCIKNCR
jgi:hypothetical protein